MSGGSEKCHFDLITVNKDRSTTFNDVYLFILQPQLCNFCLRNNVFKDSN
jgi:hypothetical protein